MMQQKSIKKEVLSVTAVTFVIALAVSFSRGLTGCTSLKEVLFVLGDSFFIAGAITGSIGGLIWVGSKGSFDLFGYGMHSLFSHGRKDKEDGKEEDKGLKAYREEQEQKRREHPAHPAVAIIGIIFLFIGMLCSVYEMKM